MQGKPRAACAGKEPRASTLLELLAGGQGIVADKVIACLPRADRQSLGLACKALQDEVAARWRCLGDEDHGLRVAEVLHSKLLPKLRRVESLTVTDLTKGTEKERQLLCSDPFDGDVLRRLEEIILEKVEDLYRLLLVLKHNGARVKRLSVSDVDFTGYMRVPTDTPLELPPACSAPVAGQPPQQPHDWELTADSLQQLQPAPYLEQLEVELGDPMDTALLQPLLRAPALKDLSLLRVKLLSGGPLDLTACAQLEELHLYQGVVTRRRGVQRGCTDARLHGLQELRYLKEVKMDGLTLSMELLCRLSSLPALETLCLRSCQLPEQNQLNLQPTGACFRSLKALEVEMPRLVWGQALNVLLTVMPQLERLQLSFVAQAPRLTLDGLPQLTQLTVSECQYAASLVEQTHIDGAFMRQLAQHQRRLQHLGLSSDAIGNEVLTTQDVQAYLDAAPQGLKTLTLKGFPRVLQGQLVLPATFSNNLHMRLSSR